MTDYKATPPNLDLIQRVQQARMQHDAQAIPSQVSAVYWIEAKRQAGDYPAVTARSGQWVLETDLQHVDALWAQIKQATHDGLLGYKAKVSTHAGSGQTSTDARMICIRTYDYKDTGDVERIRQALSDLGIECPMRYEVDKPETT